MRGRRRSSGPRAGLAGIEFALVAPMLLTFLLGTVDLSGALLTARRLEIAASQTAEMATTSSATTASENVLTQVQAWKATTVPFAFFPQWTGKLARGTFAITLSDVEFKASPAGCTTGCGYAGAVAWSLANELGRHLLRACGPVAKAPDDAAPSYTTLPAGDFGPTSLLVADVSYTFTPMFFGFIIGDIPMMQSAAVSPRIGSGVTLAGPAGAAAAVKC